MAHCLAVHCQHCENHIVTTHCLRKGSALHGAQKPTGVLACRAVYEMLSKMKRLKVGCAAGGLVVAAMVMLAVEGPESASPPASRPTPSVETQARMLSIKAKETELNAQRKLLSELAALHLARADSARSSGNSDVARWEGDAAREYTDRAGRLEKDLVNLAKDRMEAEKAAGISANSSAGSSTAVNPQISDGAAYLSKLQEFAWDTEQQLAAIAELTAVHTVRLQTNNTPEEVGRISDELERYRVDQRALRKDLSDFELRRLEFRALRPSQ